MCNRGVHCTGPKVSTIGGGGGGGPLYRSQGVRKTGGGGGVHSTGPKVFTIGGGGSTVQVPRCPQ